MEKSEKEYTTRNPEKWVPFVGKIFDPQGQIKEWKGYIMPTPLKGELSLKPGDPISLIYEGKDPRGNPIFRLSLEAKQKPEVSQERKPPIHPGEIYKDEERKCYYIPISIKDPFVYLEVGFPKEGRMPIRRSSSETSEKGKSISFSLEEMGRKINEGEITLLTPKEYDPLSPLPIPPDKKIEAEKIFERQVIEAYLEAIVSPDLEKKGISREEIKRKIGEIKTAILKNLEPGAKWEKKPAAKGPAIVEILELTPFTVRYGIVDPQTDELEVDPQTGEVKYVPPLDSPARGLFAFLRHYRTPARKKAETSTPPKSTEPSSVKNRTVAETPTSASVSEGSLQRALRKAGLVPQKQEASPKTQQEESQTPNQAEDAIGNETTKPPKKQSQEQVSQERQPTQETRDLKKVIEEKGRPLSEIENKTMYELNSELAKTLKEGDRLIICAPSEKPEDDTGLKCIEGTFVGAFEEVIKIQIGEKLFALRPQDYDINEGSSEYIVYPLDKNSEQQK